ncbi:MAG: 3-hydroxyacyl-[acyl-carrier-protein] dehydratase FabZ [Gammaproteobacteria bacterium RIFCSPLOWO2_02_FULL_52_10]|nr:MAG: 3-hydroxyacyl-[acyl-carrier-protein] dehydratase FabZ [Gammaproteobacteria bacterium RIFCSPLOWO2_02_FULL_52_10]
MAPLDINVIKNYLPHRYPFLLIDRIVDYEKDKYLTALKNVTMNEPFFLGHFPAKPIMPGVLIVEAMAQSSAILGNLSMQDRPEDGSLYYLVGIDKARFRQIVVPGDQLLLKVDFLTVRRNIWKFSAAATVEGKIVASAEFLTTVVDPDA